MRTDGPLLPLLAPRDYASDTRARLDRLTEELATGRQADTGRALTSDFSTFSRVSHELRTIEARGSALDRAAIWTEVAQTSLGALDGVSKSLDEAVVTSLSAADGRSFANLAKAGDAALGDMVRILSKTDGGRAVFGNGDTSGTPPYDLETLRAETRALAQAATDLPSLLQSFDDYFAAGGGVEASAQSAFPADPLKFPLGGGESLEVPVDARDSAIRDALKQAALVAALPEAGFDVTPTDRRTLAIELPRRAAGASGDLAGLRGGLGSVEARIGLLATRLGEDRTDLEARRTDAVGTDAFDVATRLQSEMSRLETIYAVTARRSRLNLTDFLR